MVQLTPTQMHMVTILREIAKAQGTITYTDLVSQAGLQLDLSNPDHLKQLSQWLGEIFAHEVQNRRPPLSALVVRKKDRLPGSGFFLMVDSLGLRQLGEDDHMVHDRLRKEVHRHYKKP
jgi:hypothetical protein